MSLPDFVKGGLLPPGIWPCTGQEFIHRYCAEGIRAHFAKAVQDICDFSRVHVGTRIVVGGSFITDKATPADLDCILVFAEESQLPERTERLAIEGVGLDVFYCAESQPDVLGAFIKMFSQSRSNHEVGIVEIKLWDDAGKSLWEVIQEPDEATLEIIKRVYFNRQIVDRNNNKKALITVHGIRSHGEWSAEVCHIASSNGWIVAPFAYGYVEASIFFESTKRKEIVDAFRAHIDDIADRYSADISCIAHSYGTYVVASYLFGFDIPPVSIDTLILTGSILNEKLDLDRFEGRAAVVVNEVAPNDGIVKLARPVSLWSDPLIGRSGEIGFEKSSPRLVQSKCDIFDHNNVIRRDVVTKRWMPRLEVNIGRARLETFEMMKSKFTPPPSKFPRSPH